MTTATLDSMTTTPIQPSKPPLPCDEKAFIKFPKIENFYYFEPPESSEDLGISISEKIDGANLGVFVPYEGEPSFFSRNGLNATGLFTFEEDSKQLEPLIEATRKAVKEVFATAPEKPTEAGIYLWGEYFGTAINRRIKYFGKNGQFKFYDAQIVNGHGESAKLLDPFNFMLLRRKITKHGDAELSNLFLDLFIFKYADKPETLAEKIIRGCPIPQVSDYSEDNREGYIITLFSFGEKRIVSRWKLKDPSFEENGKTRKKVIKEQISNEGGRLHEIYISYFNKNRAIGILSKTPERKRIDMLVKMFIEDAKEDFNKDYKEELEGLEPVQIRFIYKTKSEPFLILKKALMEENK